MDGVGQSVAHAEDRAEGVAADSQVADVAEKLQRVSLLLQRIGGRVRRAVDGNLGTFNSTACPFAGDSTSAPDAAMLLPVVTCLSVSSGTIPLSTTNCMLLNREPSFNSIKVTPLESRRERTQPRNVTSVPTGSE